MSVPRSVTRTTKDGIKIISSVDRCQYTIHELSRAALRDVGKFLVRRVNEKAQGLKGMKKNPRVRGRSSAFQYWVRKQECDLQVGSKHGTWYGQEQELGSSKMKKRGFIRAATEENIAKIIEIESIYLSALEDEARALSLIDENEMEGGEDE